MQETEDSTMECPICFNENTALVEKQKDLETWECFNCQKTFDIDVSPLALQKKNYIESGGVRCLFCGSNNFEGGFTEITYAGANQKISCHHCGKVWYDIYTLTDVEVIE